MRQKHLESLPPGTAGNGGKDDEGEGDWKPERARLAEL